MRYAVILAGGWGQRLWPASRRGRPKQFLPLGARPGESLLAATRRRLHAVCPAERIVVVTTLDQAEMVREAVPDLPVENIVTEPVARNTAAALGLAAVHIVRRDADAVIGTVPADHHIVDEVAFARTIERAFCLAEQHPAVVTIGVPPTRAEAGFGYLKLGPPLAHSGGEVGLEHVGPNAGTDVPAAAMRVQRFVEKPDPDTARAYLAAGDYLWNAGMFFVAAGRLLGYIEQHLPQTAAGLSAIARALARDAQSGIGAGELEGRNPVSDDESSAAAVARRVYPELPAISIDHGVMERISDVITVPADFGWSDVGSWAALADYRAGDEVGNIMQGTVVCHDARNNIAVTDTGHSIALVGVEGLVVVQAGNAVLVVARERAQDVRAAVAMLAEQGLDTHL